MLALQRALSLQGVLGINKRNANFVSRAESPVLKWLGVSKLKKIFGCSNGTRTDIKKEGTNQLSTIMSRCSKWETTQLLPKCHLSLVMGAK